MVILKIFIGVAALLASSVQAGWIEYRGADLSSLPMLEKNGVSYSSWGNKQPLEKIAASNGLNTIRQRVWVNPSDGVYGLDYNLALSKRVAAAGMSVFLNLHFSDTWADPSHQTTPKGWSTVSIDTLAWQVYNYTKWVSDSYASAGIRPSIISIGNEVTVGLLWPLGKLSKYTSAEWHNVARLLHSAAWGIKDSNLGSATKIMIHTDNGWNVETQKWWYSTLLSAGPLAISDFDIIGLSYYPFYNPAATLDALRGSLGTLASMYPSTKLVVTETNWPVSCTNPAYQFPGDTTWIPFSTDGQAQWSGRLEMW